MADRWRETSNILNYRLKCPPVHEFTLDSDIWPDMTSLITINVQHIIIPGQVRQVDDMVEGMVNIC